MDQIEIFKFKQDRIATIDVFRGIAIFGVIVFHAFGGRLTYDSFSGWAENISPKSLIKFLLAFGASGVNLFFVISGFCIHAAVAKASSKLKDGRAVRINWKNFFFKRFWRLYPVHFLTILIFALIPGIKLLLNGQNFVLDTTALWLHTFFLHTFSTQYFFSINPANWSLGTEVQFYLMYPLFLLLNKKIPTGKLLIYTTVFSFIYRIGFIFLIPKISGYIGPSLPPVEDVTKYHLTAILGFGPVRFNEWLLGCYLAELIYLKKDPLMLTKIPLWFYICIGTMAIISQFNAFTEVVFFHPAVSFLFLGLMLHYLMQKDDQELCASKKVPSFSMKTKIKVAFSEMGVRAYSMYLLHFPLLHMTEEWLRYGIKQVAEESFLLILILKSVSVGFVILVSAIFYRYLEMPLEIYSKKFRLFNEEALPQKTEKALG